MLRMRHNKNNENDYDEPIFLAIYVVLNQLGRVKITIAIYLHAFPLQYIARGYGIQCIYNIFQSCSYEVVEKTHK